MSIFDTQDWDQVLQPLPGDQPCGADLQYDATYDSIRRARQDDTDSLPAGVWERQSRKIDWESVAKQCFGFLTQRSKDLQVCAWMVESFVHGHGLQGAVRGVSLFSEMAMIFWVDVHPRIEESDIDLRLRPLNWLLRESLGWFSSEFPGIRAAETDDERQHVHWQTLQSKFVALEAFLTEHIPDHALSFREVHAALHTQCVATIPSESTGPGLPGAPFTGGSVNSRDAAYKQLRDIAVFLARVEPHSPVPMVLDTLVAWRDVSFEDLLVRLPAQGGASVYELLKLFRQDASS